MLDWYLIVIISLFCAIIGFFLGKYYSEKNKPRLYLSPSKSFDHLGRKVLLDKNKKMRCACVANFFFGDLKGPKRIVKDLHIVVENTSKKTIEEIQVSIQFPQEFYWKDAKPYKEPIRGIKTHFQLISSQKIAQFIIKIASLNPKSKITFMVPISIDLAYVRKGFNIDNPIAYLVRTSDFSYDLINFNVSAKDLENHIIGRFWLLNCININPELFFNREKKFFAEIGKNYRYRNFLIGVYQHRGFKPRNAVTFNVLEEFTDDTILPIPTENLLKGDFRVEL